MRSGKSRQRATCCHRSDQRKFASTSANAQSIEANFYYCSLFLYSISQRRELTTDNPSLIKSNKIIVSASLIRTFHYSDATQVSNHKTVRARLTPLAGSKLKQIHNYNYDDNTLPGSRLEGGVLCGGKLHLYCNDRFYLVRSHLKWAQFYLPEQIILNIEYASILLIKLHLSA